MTRVSLVKKKGVLTPREKLELEVLASTPRADHEATYGEIADLTSQKHEQRFAEQGQTSEKTKAAIIGTAFELDTARKRHLIRNVMRVTKKEGE